MEGINPRLELYAPNWYNRLTRQSIDELWAVEHNGNGNWLAIDNCRFCIVGETHNFSSEYIRSRYCDECSHSFTGGFYNVIEKRNETLLKFYIDQFVAHCDLKHRKLVEVLVQNG